MSRRAKLLGGAAVVVLSTVVASIVLTGSPQTRGGAPRLANLWVDTNGGTCTRSAKPAEYRDKAACSTFDEAYDVSRAATGAACGDLVLIKAGEYPRQTLTGYRSNCADPDAHTVFAPEGFDCDAKEYPTSPTPVVIKGTVAPGDAQIDGAESAVGHVTLCGLTTAIANVTNTNSSGSATDESRYGVGVRGSRYLTYKRSLFGGFGVFLTGFDQLNPGTGHISFLYNSIGPCHEYSNVCANGKLDIVQNVLVEGNFFHDYRSLSNCTSGGEVDCGHHETMFINGTVGATIRGNRFFNYEQSGAVYATCSGGDVTSIVGFCHKDLLVENNWFEAPSNVSTGMQDPGDGGQRGEAVLGPGHCEGKDGTDFDNVTLRNNTVVGESGEILIGGGGVDACVIGSGGFRITGNIANRITSPVSGCSLPNLTIDYNIGTIYPSNGSNPCGSNRHNATRATSILVNPTWGSLNQDAHLLSDSTVAAGFVPASAGCPKRDIDGDARPIEDACDAGADER